MTNPEMEGISWLRFALATTTVVGLLALLAWGLKYFALRGWIASTSHAARRLKLIETLPLDARRRLVIVRCDEVEHLLVLGPQQETIVASNLPSPNEPAPSP